MHSAASQSLRPSRNPASYTTAPPRLFERLATVTPRLAIFHGVTGYRPFLRHALNIDRKQIELGPQPETIVGAYLYVAPNPSPANAHFTLEDQIA